MPKASPAQTAFNAGEISPRVYGRVDFGKYTSAVKRMENFKPLVQGPARRRSGTRFVAAVKDSSKRAWLVRFVFNVDQVYVIEFGHLYVRFYTNHGQLTPAGSPTWDIAATYAADDYVTYSGLTYRALRTTVGDQPDISPSDWVAATIYELTSPYSEADLVAEDGSFKLSYVQSGDVVYLAHPDYAPRKLSRVSALSWTLGLIAFTNGPFTELNDTATTVYAGAATGATTLTASSSIFVAGDVGRLFYLRQKQADSTLQWEVGKAVALAAVRRSDGKNYEALNAATTGSIRPTHTEGALYDGDAGVQWQFLDPGFGVAEITGYTSGTAVNITVVRRIPANAVGAGNPSTRWAKAAWSAAEGWPERVTLYRERLVFSRGRQLWFSVSGDFENFDDTDFGLVTADSAVTMEVTSDESNDIQWMVASDALLAGTAGGEFSVSEETSTEPFGPENRRAAQQSSRGANGVQPVRVGDAVLFVQAAGKKLREMNFSIETDGYQTVNLSVLAEHIVGKGNITSMAYQQEPDSVLWVATSEGALLSFTYDREQDVLAWARQPLGGAGVVECVQTVPHPDGGRDELWLAVKRTINGQTQRYVEYMEVDFEDADDPQDAFYVDSGLSYDGAVNATLTPGAGATTDEQTGVVFTAGSAVFVSGDVGRFIHYRYVIATDDYGPVYATAKAQITGYTSSTVVTATIRNPWPSLAVIAANGWRLTATTISGLSHLEGATIDLLVDGATHPQRTVASGAITLAEPASKVHAGLPIRARLITLPIEAGSADGTAQGKVQRIHKLTARVVKSLGGKIGGADEEDKLVEFEYRSGNEEMDEVPPLYSGDLQIEFPGDYELGAAIVLVCDTPLPFTISAFYPQLVTAP